MSVTKITSKAAMPTYVVQVPLFWAGTVVWAFGVILLFLHSSGSRKKTKHIWLFFNERVLLDHWSEHKYLNPQQQWVCPSHIGIPKRNFLYLLGINYFLQQILRIWTLFRVRSWRHIDTTKWIFLFRREVNKFYLFQCFITSSLKTLSWRFSLSDASD